MESCVAEDARRASMVDKSRNRPGLCGCVDKFKPFLNTTVVCHEHAKVGMCMHMHSYHPVAGHATGGDCGRPASG